MAERLPDRMTVKLQVLQRFQELGETPSPQQVIQATDETMAEIEDNIFSLCLLVLLGMKWKGRKILLVS